MASYHLSSQHGSIGSVTFLCKHTHHRTPQDAGIALEKGNDYGKTFAFWVDHLSDRAFGSVSMCISFTLYYTSL